MCEWEQQSHSSRVTSCSLNWTSQKECQLNLSGWELKVVNKQLRGPLCAALDEGNGEIISHCPSSGPWTMSLHRVLFCLCSSLLPLLPPPHTFSFVCFNFKDMLEYFLRGEGELLMWNTRHESRTCLWLCSISFLCLSCFTLYPSQLFPVSWEAHPLGLHQQCMWFLFLVFCFFYFALWLQEQDRSSDVLSRMTLRHYFQSARCAKTAHRHWKSQNLSEPCHTTLSASDFSTTLFCSSLDPGVDPDFILQYYLAIS